MEDFQMYSKIQQKKLQGFSRDAVARQLELNWRTVDHYWEMTAADYEIQRTRQYASGLDSRKDIILMWLRNHEDVSAAQIQDWLDEHYQERYKERTVRDYVAKLRMSYDLPRQQAGREYGSIPELPPGVQMQADFGFFNAERPGSRRIKLYFVIFILAHSRYKYLAWQTRHFTSIDLVRSLESCFQAMGGRPEQLVIDQDRLMVVDENYGDIIFTQEFERCKHRHGFAVHVCRKSDPESKGMVESGVKYVKYNFARNRTFVSLEQWSQDSDAWLERTGNGKVHAETKKIPAEVFKSEKLHLKPVIFLTSLEPCTEMVTTPVRKNNTIRYGSSRYTVPIGTYTSCSEVNVKEEDGHLLIYNPDGLLIDTHRLALAPGELVRNTNHARNLSEKVDDLLREIYQTLGQTAPVEQFLQRIRKTRGRYVRDQFQQILNVVHKYELEILRKAVQACNEVQSNAATDFKDFAEHLYRQIIIDEIEPVVAPKLLADSPLPRFKPLKVNQHAPSVYQEIIRKGGN